MRALVRFSPEPGGLRVQEMPDPRPARGQVVLRVAACGICGSDVHFRHQRAGAAWRYPYVVGHEFAGTIAEIGDGVTGFAIGEAVTWQPMADHCGTCAMCRAGRFNSCRLYRDVGFGPDGGHAELAAVDAAGLHRLPPSVSVEDAAICEPLALAHRTVFECSQVCAGQSVVVLGCGPVGLLCATLALAAGAEVLVSGWSGDEARLDAARAIGVHHVACAAEEDLPAQVADIAGVDGPDAIIDAAGSSDTFAQALRMAPPFGRVTKVGWFGPTRDMALNAIVRKNLRIRGVYGNEYGSWERCIRILASGALPLEHLLTHRLPLSEWGEGYRLMEERQAVKVLLLPDSKATEESP